MRTNGYYIASGEAQKGPYTLDQLRSMWSQGLLTANDFYWYEGLTKWYSLHQLMATSATGIPAPAASEVQVMDRFQPQTGQPPQRQRIIYILFGLFFGQLGIHNFYAGYPGRGIAKIVLTFICGVIAGSVDDFPGIVFFIIPVAWILFELFSVTKSADGRPMV